MRSRSLPVSSLLALVGVLACAGQGSERSQSAQAGPAAANTEQQLPPTPLEADITRRDLGRIGIRDGVVETVFRVRNGASQPVHLAAIYTSCMCTTATLQFKDGTSAGPFGMPGHDLPTTVDRTLAPGESFEVHASFDPMAHGPDAVGPVRRGIAIHSDNGSMLELDFTADVVKQLD